jgi:hypothetical protein
MLTFRFGAIKSQPGSTRTSDGETQRANRNKITQAIAECNRYIALEGSRSADLRPADIQKLLEWYIAHRAKLLSMLEAVSA